MSQPLLPDQLAQLEECFAMAQDPSQRDAATELFIQLRQTISDENALQMLIDLLWGEVLSARRSGAFWQQISDVEKDMSERLAQNHVQLQQNYLRLVQEQ